MTFTFKKLVIPATVLTMVIAFNAFASTPEPPAMPRDYVVDLAGIIRSDVKNRLNASLQELEKKTTSQVLILTVLSLDGQSIEEFTFNTKEKWKLGQKGKDNGVLIVVAVKDRKYRFEVGYGLENVLPDSLVGTIGREYLVPYFKKGDYSTGITNAAVATIQTIAHHEGVQIIGMPANKQYSATKRKGNALQDILFLLFIVSPVIIGLIRGFARHGSRYSRNNMWWGGGSSGGFGGFGGGSFGGGGGGSGGGGGASGGW